MPYWRDVIEQRRLTGLVIPGEDDTKGDLDVAGNRASLRANGNGGLKVATIPGVGHRLQVAADKIHPEAVELTVRLASL